MARRRISRFSSDCFQVLFDRPPFIRTSGEKFIGLRPEYPVASVIRPTGMNGRKIDCARGGVRFFQQKSPGAAPRIPRGVLYSGPTGIDGADFFMAFPASLLLRHAL